MKTPILFIALPTLAGGKITARPPIPLLYSTDRGLRDGDWKIVSFRKQPWEFYHVSRDRTELHDLAAEQPERVERMSKQWHDMTANFLTAPRQECAPVDDKATPERHPEWTNFNKPLTKTPAPH